MTSDAVWRGRGKKDARELSTTPRVDIVAPPGILGLSIQTSLPIYRWQLLLDSAVLFRRFICVPFSSVNRVAPRVACYNSYVAVFLHRCVYRVARYIVCRIYVTRFVVMLFLAQFIRLLDSYSWKIHIILFIILINLNTNANVIFKLTLYYLAHEKGRARYYYALINLCNIRKIEFSLKNFLEIGWRYACDRWNPFFGRILART